MASFFPSAAKLAKKLGLVRQLRKEAAEEGKKLPGLLETEEAPRIARELLSGKEETPERMLARLNKVIPKNVGEMLYGDIVRAVPKGYRMPGEDFASSPVSPRFNLERPVEAGSPTNALGEILRDPLDTRRMLEQYKTVMDRTDPTAWERSVERMRRILDEQAPGGMSSWEAAFREADRPFPDFDPFNTTQTNVRTFLNQTTPSIMRFIRDTPEFLSRAPISGRVRPYDNAQRIVGGPDDSYFERALTTQHPSIMGLPEELFSSQHFDSPRPVLGHLRGVRDTGNNVFIDELQSDLLRKIQAYQSAIPARKSMEIEYEKFLNDIQGLDRIEDGSEEAERLKDLFVKMKTHGRDFPNLDVAGRTAIPGPLQGIFGNLGKAALHRAAQSGAGSFGIAAPDSAKWARDMLAPFDRKVYAGKRASEIDEIERKHYSDLKNLEKVYGETLENEFYKPMEDRFGLKFRDFRLDPSDLYDPEMASRLYPEKGMIYRQAILPDDVRREIIKKGIPGFNEGGQVDFGGM